MRNIINKRIDIKVAIISAVVMFSAVVLAFQLPVSAANTFPAVYDLISVNNVDGKGVNRTAEVGGISYDGSKILFTSQATNLPSSNSTAMQSGYIRDINSGVTQRVDVSASGIPGDKWSAYYSMSTTGRYVAFMSYATNLIDGVTLTSLSRLYVKDLQTNIIERITMPTEGGFTYPSSVSDDGRLIGIATNNINNIVPGTRTGTNTNYMDSLIYDRSKNTWIIVKGSSGLAPNDNVFGLSSSCDGSLAVFSSSASNLTTNHSGSGQHVFLVDVRSGVSISDLTVGATGDAISTNPNISCNGRYVTYSTKNRTVLPTPQGGISTAPQVVRVDRFTGERQYITNQQYESAYDPALPPTSVTDAGDVVLTSGSNTSLYNRKVYFKHLSDGSGTLESVHHVYQGLNYEPAFTPTYKVASSGKYVAVSSKAAEFLGLLPSSGNGTSIPADIIRVKTGL